MKIKNFAAFAAALVVLVLGLWACSNYAGREPISVLLNQQALGSGYSLIKSIANFDSALASGNTVLSLLSHSTLTLIRDSMLDFTAEGYIGSILYEPVLAQLNDSAMVEYFALFDYTVTKSQIAHTRLSTYNKLGVILYGKDKKPTDSDRFSNCKKHPMGRACKVSLLWTCTPSICEKYDN